LIGPAIARQLLQIVFFQQIGLVIGIGPIFDPLRPDLKTRLWSVTPRFFGWASHATSLHEALVEEADSNNSFHRFHALYRDRTRSISVLAAVQVLARPLRVVQTQAPPRADKL
jgi:hypothetical protein